MSFSLELPLPDWLDAYLSPPRRLDGPAACMALAVELSAQNILNQTGGPFGAAVVDARSGELLGVGVNLVVRSGLTMAHAEMVALAVAQLRLHAAGGRGNRQLLLATSAEPCAMCLGGIHWAGVSSVLIGARDEDVRAIGFDEGHKPEDWEARWRLAGITVIRDVLRAEASAVLQTYARIGGMIYNPGKV